MRADLLAAMKARRTEEAGVLRSLIAALDNAEAPPLPAGQSSADQHKFVQGSAEVDRLSLDATQVRDVLLAAISEREAASSEMQRVGRMDQAELLRTEAQIAKGYLA